MSIAHVSVLVIDDNTYMRKLVRAMLNGLGIRQVIDAASTADGIETLFKEPIDLALVDYHLSGSGGADGIEFCRHVRTSPDSPNQYLPIIMLTAYSERSRVLEAVDAGVDEFLVKPLRAIDLANRLNAVIDRRRPFVRTEDYFGPDRRRKIDVRYKGPRRRMTDETEFAL